MDLEEFKVFFVPGAIAERNKNRVDIFGRTTYRKCGNTIMNILMNASFMTDERRLEYICSFQFIKDNLDIKLFLDRLGCHNWSYDNKLLYIDKLYRNLGIEKDILNKAFGIDKDVEHMG